MSAGYPVREELKKAWPSYSIDYSRPMLRPMIRAIVEKLHSELALYQAPEGIRIREIRVEQSGGEPEREESGREPVTCYVIEPDDGQIRPAMLFCHGGGFFLPLQSGALALCAAYVQETGMRIFLPEYGILPEHRGADAFWDCMIVWQELFRKAEEYAVALARILLYGESAGGALAAGIALRCRDEKHCEAAGMLLVYPVLDDRSDRYASMKLYSKAAWSSSSNQYMWQEYLRDGTEGMEQYLVPMRNEDLAGLPAMYIEPQEIDTLRDEAIAFADRAESAGNTVKVNLLKGSFHGFDSDPGNAFVQEVIRDRAAFMRSLLQETGVKEQ